MHPSVSVIIPVVNGGAVIAEAVESALDQDYPGPLDVVIALGPSTDDTAAVLADLETRRPGRVTVVANPSGLTGAGLNVAIRASSGEIVARCDAQARLPHGYLARAVETLARTGADNVGGVQAAEGDPVIQEAIAIAQTTPMGVGDARYRIGGMPGPVDTVYLGVFRRAALERVNGFDGAQVRNQDYELNWRLRATGGTIWFDPELRVIYRPRRSLGALWRQYFGYGKWKRVMLRKHPGALRWRQMAPPTLVLALILSLALAFTPWPWAALATPVLYAAALAVTTIAVVARRRRWAAVAIAIVLPVMHIAWGLGFLIGRARPPPSS